MSDIVKPLPYFTDLNEPIGKTELHTLFVMSESLAHRFEIEIRSGGKAADLTGCTATGYFTNFKEKTTISVPGKVEGSKAVVTLNKPCYTLHGQFVLIIQVKAGDVDTAVFHGEGFMRTNKAEKIIYDDYIIYDVNTLLAEISAMKTATSEANTATIKANTATKNANNATTNANNAAAKINGMTVSAVKGNDAGAAISEVSGVKHISFTLPKGDKGDKGDKGEPGAIENLTINGKPVESGNISLTAGDLDAVSKSGDEMSGALTVPYLDIKDDDYCAFLRIFDTNKKERGLFRIGADNVLGVGSKETGSSYGEYYTFPTVTEGLTESKYYSVLTTKKPVSVAQGGTGATSASAARTALGVSTKAETLLAAYPVGSIYMAVNSTSPASLIGGTWEQLKDRFLLGAGSTYAGGATGGAATVTLTTSQIPSHNHPVALYNEPWNNPDHENVMSSVANAAMYGSYSKTGGMQFRTAASEQTYAGGGQSHNNMPPYLVVYMWKRVS